MVINGFEINDSSPTYIIAEVGINHNGNIKNALQLIKEAKNAGAHSVKLQSYITEKRVAKDSPVYDILKNCELSFDNQLECFKLGKEIDITIFSTPFDDESVDFLESANCPIYKIASFDSVNKKLLRKVGSTNKPVIMSTGMTNLKELEDARDSLNKDGQKQNNLALLHCISSYPTPNDEANLAVINFLKSIHKGPIGYSDHTIGIEIPLYAVMAGAKIIEKHFTLDTSDVGPDHALSANPDTLKKLIDGLGIIEKTMGKPTLRTREIEKNIIPYRRFSD